MRLKHPETETSTKYANPLGQWSILRQAINPMLCDLHQLPADFWVKL